MQSPHWRSLYRAPKRVRSNRCEKYRKEKPVIRGNGLGKEEKEKRKMDMGTDNEGPVRKKAKVAMSEGEKSEKAGKRKTSNDQQGSPRRRKSTSSKSNREDDLELSGSASVAPTCSTSNPSPIAPTDPVHNEICGMLIETLAMSRASSLPASALYKALVQRRPTLKSERTDGEWVTVIEDVLEEAQSQCGVFDSSGMVCFICRLSLFDFALLTF